MNFGDIYYQYLLSNAQYEKIALNSLVDISRGASPRPIQKFLTDKGMPWIKISDVTSLSNPFLYKTNEFITDEGVKHSCKVFVDDFILSNSATPCIPIFVKTNACVHDGWLVIRNFKKISPYYLFWILRHDKNEILRLGNGSIFTNLKTEILKEHKIPLFENMDEYNCKFKTILNFVEQVVEKNNKLKEIKSQLLQKYFG